MTKTAFFGDSVGWAVYAIDLTNDPMSVVKAIPTGLGPYPVDRVAPDTLFGVTRGERSVEWIDLASLTRLGAIPLAHKPRSATGNGRGLAIISGADQPRTSVLDLAARRVRLVVGDEVTDRVEDFGGSLASGHEAWLPDAGSGAQRFFLVDRVRRRLAVFRYPDGMRLWSINTPTSVHHLVQDRTDKTLWYALCEGSQKGRLPPSILAIREAGESAFEVVAHVHLPVGRADLPRAGAHHVDEDPNHGHLYVGSNEGFMYVLDKRNLTGDALVAKIPTGSGCGHTRFTTFDSRTHAVVINHLAQHVTVIDADRTCKLGDIQVTSSVPATVDDKTQGHTTKVYDDQPSRFYMMASMDAVLRELDLRSMCVARSVQVRQPAGNVKPVLMQGIFV